MRKVAIGSITMLCLTLQHGFAEAIITAQDCAIDSDVVLESVVREIKSAPRDAVNAVGDGVNFVADEFATLVNGVKAIAKSNPIDKVEKEGLLEVANAWDSANDIVFRSYKVTDEVGKELMQGAASDGTTIDVSAFFTGIPFPKKTSVYFRPDFNRLFVRNTLENILSVEDVLAEQHSAVRELMGKQVSIETKFVEVNQSTLNELGFNWKFDGKGRWNANGTPNGNVDGNVFENLILPAGTDLFVDGLRTAGRVAALNAVIPGLNVAKQAAFGAATADSDTFAIRKTEGSLRWTMLINAMEQSDDTDVLSAPSITTRDRNTATIKVGESRTVSTGFDVNSAETSLYVEHDLEPDFLVGVSLEVTPEIRSDDLIDLELKPKVLDLIGYDTYQAHPSADMFFDGNVNNGTGFMALWANPLSALDPDGARDIPATTGSLPYYRLREMETQVTVADGSTVGMGGLIYDKLETFKDKVPVLGSIPLIGRLFRSEGEKSVKRNLLIFVTATQVDVNGRKASELALKR